VLEKKQINTVDYWDKKWSDKKLGGKYGQNQYYFLESHLPKEAFSCLDLGCGRGAGIEFLADARPGGLFWGIDFSDVAIAAAKAKLKRFNDRVVFKCDDVYKMKLEDLQFDYILMIELLEHLRWPFQIVDRFLPICRKAIYISIPAYNWDLPEHLYAYGSSENPFERYGAEILEQYRGRKKIVIRRK